MKLLELEDAEIYFYPEKGMLDCNTYLIRRDKATLIDPGSMQTVEGLISDLERDGVDLEEIECIVNTHLHLDHCLADDYFRQASGARVLFHPLQKKFYHVVVGEVAGFFGFSAPQVEEDGILNELENVEIFATPGHSPDSICFFVEGCMICGDLVFEESVGRVDMPGGDSGQLKESIGRIAKMDIENLLPGHMGVLKGRENVKRNFERVKALLSWL